MTDQEMQKISTEFRVPVFETGACNVGTVVKFRTFYLKIYDGKGYTYDVQIWRYGKQMPDRVENVKVGLLLPWMRKTFCKRKVVGGYYGKI